MAYYAWEYGLRMLASVAIVRYAQLEKLDASVDSALQSLSRPALGHWQQIVRLLTPILSDNGDPGFTQIKSVLFGKQRDDLLDVIRLDQALRRVIYDKGTTEAEPRQSVRVSEVFERMGKFRNKEIGHGLIGGRASEFYQELLAPFLAGVTELWRHIDVLGGRRLFYVSDVRALSSGDWRIERFDLGNEKAEILPNLDLPKKQVGDLPVSKQLYLVDPEQADAPGSWSLLFPLALYELERNELFFYGGSDKKSRADYTGSSSGEPRQVDPKEQQVLLSRLLRIEVSAEQIEAWSAENQKEFEAPESTPTPERRMIGDFELISRLGSGGEGTVYRARQASLNRIVAVKRLARSGDPKAQERFARQIRALGRVEHPNLVKVYASRLEGDDFYFAMELIEGADLSRVLENLAGSDVTRVDSNRWRSAVSTACEHAKSAETPISKEESEAEHLAASPPVKARTKSDDARVTDGPIAQSVKIIRDVAGAVQALHEASVIHRDIKPGNIMLSNQGDAILMDLGLAKLGDVNTMTASRQFMGTIRYSSPEQILDAKKVNVQSDIYSLGATLWELLTLKPLLRITEETPEHEARLRVISKEPESVRAHNPHVPKDLARIVAKCLDKACDSRYRSAADLAADLTRWLEGEPVLAQNPTLAYLLSKAARKHWRAVAASAALFAFIILSLSIALVLVTREKNTAVRLLGDLKVSEQKRKENENAAATAVKQVQLERAKGLDLKIRNSTDRVLRAVDMGRTLERRQKGLRELVETWFSTPSDHPLSSSLERVALDRLQRFAYESRVNRDSYTQDCALQLSPDGSRCVFHDRNQPKKLTLWNTITGDRIVELAKAHEGEFLSFAFSEDGRLIAVANSAVGECQVHSCETGDKIGSAVPLRSKLCSLQFAARGKRLAVESKDENLARVYSVPEMALVKQVHDADYFSLMGISPDGRLLLTESRFKNVIYEIDSEALRECGQGNFVSTMFSPNGRVAISELKGSVRDRYAMISLASDEETRVLADMPLCFSLDGETLLSLDIGRKRIYLDSVENPLEPSARIQFDFRGDWQPDAAMISPDGAVLAIWNNYHLQFIDLLSREAQSDIALNGEIFNANFLAGGELFCYSAGHGRVAYVAVNSGSEVGLLAMDRVVPDKLEFRGLGPTGELLASPPPLERLVAANWSPMEIQSVGNPYVLPGESYLPVQHLHVSSDGSKAVYEHDSHIVVIDRKSQQVITQRKVEGSICDLAFSRENLPLALVKQVGGPSEESEWYRLIDIQTDQLIQEFKPETWAPFVTMTQNADAILIATQERMSIWRRVDGEKGKFIFRQRDYPTNFKPEWSLTSKPRFSPSRNELFWSGSDALHRWRYEMGAEGHRVLEITDIVDDYQIDPNEKFLFSGTAIVDLESEAVVVDGMAHLDGAIELGRFISDGKLLATFSRDSMRFWDTATGQLLGQEPKVQVRSAIEFASPTEMIGFNRDTDVICEWKILRPAFPKDTQAWAQSVYGRLIPPTNPQQTDSEAAIELKPLREKLVRDQQWLDQIEKTADERRLLRRAARVRTATNVEQKLSAIGFQAAKYHLPWLREHDPHNLEWPYCWAEIHFKEKAYESAAEGYLKAISIDPKNSLIHCSAACALMMTGDGERIQSHLLAFLDLAEKSDAPQFWDEAAWTAVHYSSTKTPWSRVITLAMKAVAANPKSSAYRETLAAAHFRAGELGLAEKELLEAKRLYHEPRGSELKSPGGEGAEAVTNEAIPIVPDESATLKLDAPASFFIHAFLALTYHQLKQPEKCIKERQTLATIAPLKADEYHDQARRALLTKEIEHTCGAMAKLSESEGAQSK